MPGGAIGTIFVELDLDSSKYEKNQQKILQGSQSTSLSIEKNYQNLGVKSDAIFDAMRNNIVNSLTMIQNKAIASSGEIARAQEAAANKIKAINEQQFGHHDSLIEGLKKNYIAASVVIIGAWMTVQKAIALMDEGAKALQQKSSFKIVAEDMGVDSGKMIASMQKYTKETVDDSELMQKATKLMLAGYNPDQIERFSKVAITASQYMGTSVTEAFDRVSDSLASRMPRAMVQAGAVTKEQMNLVSAAIKAGANETVLFDLAMANLELKALKLKGTMDEATLCMQRYHAQTKETAEIGGQILLILMRELYAVFQSIGVASLYATGGIYKLAQGYYNLKAMFTTGDLSKHYTELAVAYKADAESDFAAATKLWNQAKDNFTGTVTAEAKATKESIDGAKQVVKSQEDRLKAIVDAAKGAKDILRSVMDENKKIYEMEIEQADHATKMRILAGENELNFALEIISQKQQALNKLYEADAIAIQNSVLDETVKTAKLSALYADYNKQWQKYADQREETEVKILQGIYDHYADFYSKITGYEDKYRENKFAWIDKEEKRLALFYQDEVAAAKWAAEQKAKFEYDLFKAKTDQLAQGFSDLSTSFAGISKIYAQGSEDAKKWQDASNQMMIAQKAVAVVQAVGAIATQGLGDPYTAFVRIAAMAVAMGALLATIGESVGGQSSASMAASKSESTLLGAAAGTGSESLTNSLKLLEDTYKMENTKLTNIYNELKSLNSNIIGLVTSIVRTGGISTSGMNLDLSTTEGLQQQMFKYLSITNAGALDFLKNKTSGVASILSSGYLEISVWINDLLGGLVNSIFGGKTTSAITGQGIEIGNVLIKDILAGMNISAYQYATITKITSGGWFGSDKTNIYTVYDTLNQNVTDMLTLVFKNIGNTLMFLAKGLGTDTQAVLDYVFKATQINLQGMTTDQMNKALQEYISKISDTAVEDLFGTILKGYQKLNEGLMETAVRLITDKETILYYLKMVNQSFNGTIPEAIKFSETLITIAGSLDKLTDAMQTYYEAFFSDAEKQVKLKDQLTAILSMYGFDMPGTRGGYRALVESLNLTTEAGMAAYVALMQMSKSADEYYKYLEAAKSNIKPENYATYIDYLRALNAPAFAEGGYFAGGYRIVGENGPELEFTGASRIHSNKDSKSLLNTDELVAEIRALRAELGQGNLAVATYTQKTAKLLDQWNGEGTPPVRT